VKELIALPLLSLVLVFQTAIFSRISLLSGYADLMLVALAAWALQEDVETSWHWAILGGALIGWTSSLPWFIPIIGYILMVALARLMVRRIWQAPILAIFVIVFLGTLIMHFLSILVLRLMGSPLNIADALSIITLPSLFLNLFLALPAYPIFRDLAVWIYDIEDVQ
jgi:hypothetical protein